MTYSSSSNIHLSSCSEEPPSNSRSKSEKDFLAVVNMNSNVTCGVVLVCSKTLSLFLAIESNKSSVLFFGACKFRFLLINNYKNVSKANSSVAQSSMQKRFFLNINTVKGNAPPLK